MINKVADSIAQALANIPDQATVMIGGFGTAGIPDELIEGLIASLSDSVVQGLTLVNNNAGNGIAVANTGYGSGAQISQSVFISGAVEFDDRPGPVRDALMGRTGNDLDFTTDARPDAIERLLRTVTEVQQITNPNLDLLGAIATIYDARTTHSRDVLADVADRYDLSVINPPIPRTVRFAEASASGVSVLRGRKNKGALAYRELAENLWKHWSAGAPLETFALDL